MGIEPTTLAWKAKVMPFYDTRTFRMYSFFKNRACLIGQGVEHILKVSSYSHHKSPRLGRLLRLRILFIWKQLSFCSYDCFRTPEMESCGQVHMYQVVVKELYHHPLS